MAGYQGEGDEIHPAWALRGLALVAAHDGRNDDARRWAEAGLGRGDPARRRRHRHVPSPHPRVPRPRSTRTGRTPAPISRRPPTGWPGAASGIRAGSSSPATRSRRRSRWATSRGPGRSSSSWTRPRASRRRRGSSPSARARSALLAAAEGDFEAAASTFDRALVEHDRLPMPFERGRTLLAKGRLHRRRNEKPPGRRDAPRGARLLRVARRARLGREDPGGAGSGRPAAARPGHADRDRAARRRARGDRV